MMAKQEVKVDSTKDHINHIRSLDSVRTGVWQFVQLLSIWTFEYNFINGIYKFTGTHSWINLLRLCNPSVQFQANISYRYIIRIQLLCIHRVLHFVK